MKKSLNILLAIAILAQAVPVTAIPAWIKKADIAVAHRLWFLNWYTNDIAKTKQALKDARKAFESADYNHNHAFVDDLASTAERVATDTSLSSEDLAKAKEKFEDYWQTKLPLLKFKLDNAAIAFKSAQNAYDNAKLKPNAWAYRLAAGSISVAVLGGIAFLANKLIAKLKKNDEQVATPSVSDAKTANIQTSKTA